MPGPPARRRERPLGCRPPGGAGARPARAPLCQTLCSPSATPRWRPTLSRAPVAAHSACRARSQTVTHTAQARMRRLPLHGHGPSPRRALPQAVSHAHRPARHLRAARLLQRAGRLRRLRRLRCVGQALRARRVRQRAQRGGGGRLVHARGAGRAAREQRRRARDRAGSGLARRAALVVARVAAGCSRGHACDGVALLGLSTSRPAHLYGAQPFC